VLSGLEDAKSQVKAKRVVIFTFDHGVGSGSLDVISSGLLKAWFLLPQINLMQQQ
jgi:hypothetical protein